MKCLLLCGYKIYEQFVSNEVSDIIEFFCDSKCFVDDMTHKIYLWTYYLNLDVQGQ